WVLTMGRVERAAYRPDPARADAYDALYAEYRELHEHFGTPADKQLHRLRNIRNAALTQNSEES
ncbi:ribulokinase, partial [Kitasatospora sp. NPDC004799]